MNAPTLNEQEQANAAFKAIVERSWADESFKQALLEDATAVLTNQGMPIPQGLKIHVVENSSSVVYIVLPARPHRVTDIPQVAEQEAGGPSFLTVVVRSWTDEHFKKRFLEDATSVLKEQGMEVPQGMKIHVLENSPSVFNMVLPENPNAELSDEDLELVAGGTDNPLIQSNLVWLGSNMSDGPGSFTQFTPLTLLPMSALLSPMASFWGINSGPSSQIQIGPYGTATFSGGGS